MPIQELSCIGMEIVFLMDKHEAYVGCACLLRFESCSLEDNIDEGSVRRWEQ